MTDLSQESSSRVGCRGGVTWNYSHTLAGEFTKAGCMPHGRSYKEPVFDNFEGCNDYLHWLKEKKGPQTDIIDDGMEVNSWVCRPYLYEETYHHTNWTVSQSIVFTARNPFYSKKRRPIISLIFRTGILLFRSIVSSPFTSCCTSVS